MNKKDRNHLEKAEDLWREIAFREWKAGHTWQCSAQLADSLIGRRKSDKIKFSNSGGDGYELDWVTPDVCGVQCEDGVPFKP